MSIVVETDVGGHLVTLHVNGARLTMDICTAHKVASFLGATLDALAHDTVVKHNQHLLSGAYRHEQA